MKTNFQKRGLSLLEVLLALAVLGSGLVLLIQSWGGQFTRLKKIDRNFEISALIQRKMAEVESKYRGKSLDEIPEGPEEEEIEGYPNYKYMLSSKKLSVPDFAAMMQAMQKDVDANTITLLKATGEYFSKSVKEVTLTLVYTPEGTKKSLEYPVTTYFVDYDKELTGVPGVGGDSGGGGTQ